MPTVSVTCAISSSVITSGGINRNLASDGRRARAGWFRTLHRRGGWLVGLLYVGACLAYGEIATTERSNRWIMSVLLSIGFTSTLLHYYFDGFIWKVRHQQNRDHLTAAAAAQEEREAAASWWTSSRRSSAAAMFARQLAYFGAPMLILTVGAVSAWSAPSKTSVQHMVVAQQLSNSGRANEAIDEAQRAYAAMEGELVVARKMARLDPSSAREAELAFLLYNRSFYGNVVLPAATGREVARAQRLEHRHNVSAAAEILQDAIDRGGPLSHATRPQFSHQDAVRTLSSWRRIAGTFQ